MAFFALVATACGCDKASSDAPAPATRPAATAPATHAAARPATADGRKPGFAAGRVLRQDGRPIAVEGMRIGVTVRGISDRTGQVVSYSPTVGADGRYEVKLEPGTYRPPAGVVEVPFNGRHYRFELDPVQRAAATFDAKAGIHEDFVWHLSGPRASGAGGGAPDESRAGDWHGGPVTMRYDADRPDLGRRLSPPPRGTRAVFTLTPTTALADGREGKPITAEREFDELAGLKNPLIPDVPLAMYSVTGVELRPDGQRHPLLFLRPGGAWGDSVEGTFDPNLESGGLEPVVIAFTRREE
jgi:hypothetical protein